MKLVSDEDIGLDLYGSGLLKGRSHAYAHIPA
jgi:hypothetical protein